MLIEADICIIGGGPAGSVLGARLAQFGFDVCLVEREKFPRRHLGESLSPGVIPLLESIGAGPALEEAAFPRVQKVIVHWEAKRVREDSDGGGMLVDRGRFDRLLLDHARGFGVRILQPATVKNFDRCEGGGWRIAVSECDRATDLKVRFLADATGRGGTLNRQRRRTGPRTLALHAYWTGGDLPDHPRIEAGTDAWFWGVPLPDGVYNTLAFLDPGDLRAMPGSLEFKFHALIAESSLIPRGAKARIIGKVEATDATPYLDENCVTEDSIKVGDAALALDPISSSGVQKAIQSALAGSAVVNTLLARPGSAGLARTFYRQHLDGASGRHGSWARSHYGRVAALRQSKFWRERAAAPLPPDGAERAGGAALNLPHDLPLRLSPDVEIVELPCVVDRFIEDQPAVRSPSLGEPVAFLGGVKLAPLLCQMQGGMTQGDLVRAWEPHVPGPKALAIARWLFSRGLIVPHEAAPVALKGGARG